MRFWRRTSINHLVINQQRVHNAADLDQSRPHAAISSKPRNLSGSHSSDFPQTDLRDHAFKASAFHITGGGTTQIFIDDLDLLPTKLLETLTHSILQATTLFVVSHLIRGRLAHIEDGLTRQMAGMNLITHRLPPFLGRDDDRREPRGTVLQAAPELSAHVWGQDPPMRYDYR